MNVIKKEKVPYYEHVCCECKSVIRFYKSETNLLHITCPVCGCRNAVTTTTPAGYDEEAELKRRDCTNCKYGEAILRGHILKECIGCEEWRKNWEPKI